jgi:hypothetical protein
MAAPHAAGVAALVFGADSQLTVSEVRDRLRTTADDVGAGGWDKYTGHGRVNAYEASNLGEPNAPPTVSITAPADGASFNEGDTISFTGTANDTEDGDVTADLVWESDLDGPIGTGGSFSSVLSPGTHTVTASVTDSGGASGSDSITVTVIPGNTPPTVSITAPAAGSSFDEGTSITFTGTANDTEDGDISAGLEWVSNLDGQIGTGGSFSAVLSVGTHTVTASVTDSGGASGSDSVTVTVNPISGGGTMHVSDLDGTNQSVRNKWNATVTITVVDSAGAPVSGALVSGAWSSGESSECTTSSGSCSVTRSGIRKNIASVTFTVGGVAHSDLTYDPGSNGDPDGDSDGTSITVPKA